MSDLEIDSIVILESLAPHEQRTGKWLYNNVLKPYAATDSEFVVSYHPISRKQHFMDALKAVDVQMIDNGHRPVIHVEAHGDREGVYFSDGSSVTWEELRDILTTMNRKTQFNLLLVMAMCEGWWLSRLLRPFEPAPAWGVVGPTVRVKDVDLRDAMEAFYRKIFESFAVIPAVEAMNQHLPANDWKFFFMSAETIFCKAFKRYIQESTPDNLQDRENELVAQFARTRTYDLQATMQMRSRVRLMLRDNKRFFEEWRRRFFLLDAIPSNAARFRVTYELCSGSQDTH